MKIIKSKDLKTATWSSGTTTEYFIYPESSSFKNLDFDFRIATATIDQEDSTFTPLVGVRRLFIPLTDTISLQHDDGEIFNLQAFEPNFFSGESKTIYKGKGQAFNLMVMDKGEVSARYISFKEPQTLSFADLVEEGIYFIYVVEGEMKTDKGNIEASDLIIIDKASSEKIEIAASTSILMGQYK